jgi:hypothetical protein
MNNVSGLYVSAEEVRKEEVRAPGLRAEETHGK